MKIAEAPVESNFMMNNPINIMGLNFCVKFTKISKALKQVSTHFLRTFFKNNILYSPGSLNGHFYKKYVESVEISYVYVFWISEIIFESFALNIFYVQPGISK